MSIETETSDVKTCLSITESNKSPESKTFVYGNPFVKKNIGGVLHFYKKISIEDASPKNCSMLCMVGVPAYITCREVIKFVLPMAGGIFRMRIIRDDTPNQYMMIIKFKTPDLAISFFEQYNDMEFNSIEVERCTLQFVEKLEMTSADDAENIEAVTYDSLTESIPTCSVCLEKMDDGLLTILCNHTFHAECLKKWSDTTCPVCRNSQTPELVPDQACKDCIMTTDLWMCLICGNIGCGRYANAHAYQHYEATSHIYTLQVGGKMVWDYASDTYVHRLIQDSTNGKMVEYEGEDHLHWEKYSEKLDAIQMEYSFLLTSQLDIQRMHFVEKLMEAEEQRATEEKESSTKISSLESGLEAKTTECTLLKTELTKSNLLKIQIEKKNVQTQGKLSKLQIELDAERQMNALLLKDKELLSRQRDELERLRVKEIANLEEQLNDLMMHFEAQSKFQGFIKNKTLSSQELEEGKVGVKLEATSTSSSVNKKSGKRSVKKSKS